MGIPTERERQLIEAAWSQFEDLASRAASGSRVGSGSAPGRSPHDPALGEAGAIRGYRILEELKRGGQGVILLAEQESTGRRVAIKQLRHGSSSAESERARFEREIDLLTRLRHPNIVAVHDRGWTQRGAYFVMDFVAGASLDEHLESLRGSTRDIAMVFAKIAEAVSAAHLLGVIHRDLKPSNIRFDERGEPKILDFGLARLAEDINEADLEITRPGQFIGSLPWASPEQVKGDSSALDVRTDVYSLGVMLYHALAGQFPYPVSGSAPAVIQHISGTEPSTEALAAKRAGDELSTIVLKCLAKEPQRRYQSAGELARDLQRYTRGEAIEAKRDSAWYVIRKLARRNRSAAVLAMVALGAILVGAAVSGVLYARAEAARDLANSRYQQALVKAEQTRQTLRFVEELFGGVSPQAANGADTTLLKNVLESARQRAQSDLKEQPEVQSAVRDLLGISYGLLGEYARAREELEAALRMRLERFGHESEPVAETLLHLATVDHNESRYDDAMARCREAEAILRAAPEAAPELTAMRLHVEGSVAMRRSEYARAYELAEQAVAIRSQALGKNDAKTLRSRSDAANALKLMGKFDEAEAGLQAVLAAQTRKYGADHSHVQETLRALGTLELDRMRPAAAMEYFEKSLAICRRAYADPSLETADVLNAMASALIAQRDYEGGLERAREARAIRLRLVPADSPRHAAVVLNIGTALKNLGRLDEAEPMYREAIDLTRGRDNRILAIALNNMGALCKARGNYEASATFDEEALRIRRSIFTGPHPDLAQSLNNLAFSMDKLHRDQEAEALYRECMQMQQALFGDESVMAARSGINCAQKIMLRDDASEEAARLTKWSADVLARSAATGDDVWSLKARFMLAVVLTSRGELADAEIALRACDLALTPGLNTTITRAAILRRLADVCEKQGKVEEAARYREQLPKPRTD
ncbi:MAG: tetratricopeptide repeat protein [Phycisphaerales bacterium]